MCCSIIVFTWFHIFIDFETPITKNILTLVRSSSSAFRCPSASSLVRIAEGVAKVQQKILQDNLLNVKAKIHDQFLSSVSTHESKIVTYFEWNVTNGSVFSKDGRA